MVEPLVQKIGNRMPGWKKNLISRSGRETLVKSILSAMPTFFMSIFKLPRWAIIKIDKFRRGFFWKGHDWNIRGCGHCLVNWKTCLLPKRWGGMGFKDLEKFGRALRLRWLWHN
jgi:hypothetical protein